MNKGSNFSMPLPTLLLPVNVFSRRGTEVAVGKTGTERPLGGLAMAHVEGDGRLGAHETILLPSLDFLTLGVIHLQMGT